MGTFKMSLASNRPTTVHQPSNGWEKKPITQFRINARHLGAVKNIANKNCEFKFESDPNYILRGNPRNNSRFAGPLSNSRSGHESPTRATLFPITFIFVRISSSCGRIRKQENTEGEFLLIPCNCQINPRFAHYFGNSRSSSTHWQWRIPLTARTRRLHLITNTNAEAFHGFGREITYRSHPTKLRSTGTEPVKPQ